MLYMLVVLVIAAVVAVVILLETSMLSGLGVRETLREVWETYFGGGDFPDAPPSDDKAESENGE